MLAKKQRLTEAYDFRRLQSRGQKFFSPLFTLIVAPVKDPLSLRFGFVASSKLDKRSSVRNRLKRVLREIIRRKLPRFKKGFDAVFYLRSGMFKKSHEELTVEVDRLLSKTPLV